MQKGPKPVFISKHDGAVSSTVRRVSSLPEPPDSVGHTDSNSVLNAEFISGQVENTLAHKTARLVETHPEDAVRVLRGWLYQE